MRRPERVLFRLSQSFSEGQHASVGRWEVLANNIEEIGSRNLERRNGEREGETNTFAGF
jgi:hypothetical protein